MAIMELVALKYVANVKSVPHATLKLVIVMTDVNLDLKIPSAFWNVWIIFMETVIKSAVDVMTENHAVRVMASAPAHVWLASCHQCVRNDVQMAPGA